MGQVYSLCQAEGAENARTAHAAPQARVFVGLRIEPEIASQLVQFVAALEKSFVRPVTPTDIHLTLVPPWNETSIPDAIAKLGRVAGRFGAFRLIFRHVGWAAAETTSSALGGLCGQR